MVKKRIPLRMCTGCGEMKPKPELVRICRSPDGAIALDLTGRAPGRGAYICRDIECFKKARKSKRLSKAFACPVPDETWAKMEEEITPDE